MFYGWHDIFLGGLLKSIRNFKGRNRNPLCLLKSIRKCLGLSLCGHFLPAFLTVTSENLGVNSLLHLPRQPEVRGCAEDKSIASIHLIFSLALRVMYPLLVVCYYAFFSHQGKGLEKDWAHCLGSIYCQFPVLCLFFPPSCNYLDNEKHLPPHCWVTGEV